MSTDCRLIYWAIVSADTRSTDALSTHDPFNQLNFYQVRQFPFRSPGLQNYPCQKRAILISMFVSLGLELIQTSLFIALKKSLNDVYPVS